MIFVLVVLIAVLILCVLKIYVFDNKVKNEKKITKKTGLNSIGQLPFNDKNGNIMIENKSKANMMKYIKDIRRNILKKQEQKVVSILSCNRGEGKSYIANNLAISISRLNKSVLLIDGNLREKSNICETFYIEKGEGFTDFIKNIEIGNKYKNLKNATEYIKQSQIPNLYVLQNGTITENSGELLKTKNAKEVIDLLKDIYDIIIIDGTSFLENEDALILSKLSDTNILVVENRKTTYKDIILSKNQLEYNNDEIYGFILNKINVIKGKYYSKFDNQNYGMFIETREEHYRPTNTEEILDPLTAKLNKKEPEKFEILRKELKENIMDEDFINDIEVNFNLKINSMEKENERNINSLLDNIDSLKREINEEKTNSDVRRVKDAKGFDKFSQMIADKFEKMEEQITLVKKKNETEGEFFERRIIEQSQRYGKQIELLNNQIENLTTKIEENKQLYDGNIEELKKELEYKDKEYKEKLFELNEQIESLVEKQENKQEIPKYENENKIINLGKFFNNKRKNNRVFSIQEPISFYDLERLATEIISLNDEDTNYSDDIAK